MTIDDILKAKGRRVFTVSPTSSLLQVVQLLARENVGSAVVTDSGAIVGIFTERDVLRLAARAADQIPSLAAGEVMTRDVLVGHSSDPVPLVMETMDRCRIRHLPVVEEGRLVGIVSMGDLVHSYLDHMEEETERLRRYVSIFLKPQGDPDSTRPDPRLPQHPGSWTGLPGEEPLPGTTAGEILQRKGVALTTVPTTATLAQAMDTMAGENIGSVLAEEGGRVRGIVTERDVLRVVARAPEGFSRLEVREVATPHLVVCAPEDRLGTLMQSMIRNRIRHLPVVREGSLEGILSMRDLVMALLGARQRENRHLRDRIHGRTMSSGGGAPFEEAPRA